MPDPKKLIEVAMPVKEISAESVRDKSIRHGHISTLHLWWARRPLPVCRAVVFASLVPDPMDENCPKAFKEAVELLLGKVNNSNDPYKPYEDIPYTAAHDNMEDNLRNRLLMFIGKFSDKYSENEKKGKKTDAKDLLSNSSLIKWDNKNNDEIIGKARKLIWVSHNAKNGSTAKELIEDFDKHYKAIKDTENDLYSTPNRHIETTEIKTKEENLQKAIDAFLDKMPKVFDPFAGGGAIPLEAARLGCKTYANDINPVAHIIQKGSIEFPQKYGKPITYGKDEFINLYGEDEFNKIDREDLIYTKGSITGVKIENRLAFDVEFYAKKLLDNTFEKIGEFYNNSKDRNNPIVYYWVKIGNCSNPSCKAEVPLLKHFYLSKRRSAPKSKWIHLKPNIVNKIINFEIKFGVNDENGWNNRGNLTCPICENVTSVNEIRKQSREGRLTDRLIAVIDEINNKKIFRKPTLDEISLINKIPDQNIPNESIQKNSAGGDTLNWGITKWGEMYSKRQLLLMHTLINEIHKAQKHSSSNVEYEKVIKVYLTFLIDRIAMRNTRHNTWHLQQDTIEKVFGRQAISMIFDYPEMNPFTNFTSSAQNQIQQIIDFIYEESKDFNVCLCQNAASGDKTQFPAKNLNIVVTDPPYYDSIAYADLSDLYLDEANLNF